MKTKLVYLAHPISGDVQGNIRKIIKLCREIHFRYDDTIPFAPYITSLQYLKDDIPKERAKGIRADEEYFRRRVMDEMWLCGDVISVGMKKEIQWAKRYKIPVKFHNKKLGK